MATTSFGVIFYFFTVVASLKSLECPFQTPVSTVLQSFRNAVRKKGEERPKSLAGFLNRQLVFVDRTFGTAYHIITKSISCFVTFVEGTFGTVKRIITKPISRFVTFVEGTFGTMRRIVTRSIHSRFVTYLLRPSAALRHRARSMADDSEADRGSEESEKSGAKTTSLGLELDSLESPVKLAEYAVQSSAVHWILATSTDPDTVTTAVRMLPEIEWLAGDDVTEMLDRLASHFYACFDPTRRVLPQSQARAVACLKAIFHLYAERDLDPSFLLWGRGRILSKFDGGVYKVRPDQDFLAVCCAVDQLVVPDIASLSVSDQTWMAHMFTYHLNNAVDDRCFVTGIVIDFIETCLYSIPPQRLQVDCLLLAGMLIGLSVDRRHLARLDKW